MFGSYDGVIDVFYLARVCAFQLSRASFFVVLCCLFLHVCAVVLLALHQTECQYQAAAASTPK